MGLTGSKKKDEVNEPVERKVAPLKRAANPDHYISKYAEILKTRGVLPDFFLVHETKSSKYVDEDGDVAHEFYQETMSDGEKGRLCKLIKNLRPKGKERYAIPRLKPDIPVVMWEVTAQDSSA